VQNRSRVEVDFYRGRGGAGRQSRPASEEKRRPCEWGFKCRKASIQWGWCNGCGLMVEEGGAAMAARVRLRHSRDVAEPYSA
jgi:hypothetical protein